MRLIEADVLKEKIHECVSNDLSIEDIVFIEKIIDSVPTAYDVEKVDKQIVEYFKTQIENVDAWKVVDFSHDIRKIVRNGGKE